MREIHKHARAENDLIEIWLYSYEQWGEAQADRYFDDLENGIEQLRRYPELGRPCGHIREGYRAFQINRHVVYYIIGSSAVHIIRVLHKRMHPGRQLADR